MPVTAADGRTIDVHTVGRRVALVVDGELIWLEGSAPATLRHKLMMAMRAVDAAPPEVVVSDVPAPRRRWLN